MKKWRIIAVVTQDGRVQWKGPRRAGDGFALHIIKGSSQEEDDGGK